MQNRSFPYIMDIVFEIQLDNGSRIRAVGDETFDLKIGDGCVFKKEYCVDYGKVVAIPGELAKHPIDVSSSKFGEIPHVMRKGTDQDAEKAAQNAERCPSTLRTTQCHVDQLNLAMKLINAHCSLDGKLITIQFSADGRVDFRELVKQLSSALNSRIELRQIGVRDETAAIGGISPCGRPLCCAAFLRDFASINVKMAKEQDLALTPTAISGVCGRLKCCLKFEHEGYLELEKTMPRRGEYCECKEGRGKVMDRNLLTQKVTIQLEDTTRSVTVPVSEVAPVPPEKRKSAPHAEPARDGDRNGRRSQQDRRQGGASGRRSDTQGKDSPSSASSGNSTSDRKS